MNQTIGWGYSLVKNPIKAGPEAAHSAMKQLNGQKCNFCIVFSTVGYVGSILLKSIRDVIGSVTMTGCSGEGVIGPGVADESNHCVVVLAFADKRMRMITAGLPDITDSSAAGQEIGDHLKQYVSEDSRCLMVFPCGLNVVADDFIKNLEERIGKQIPIIGGSSGDNHIREKTYQYHDWKIYEGGVSAALLNGDFEMITDVTHGCVPIGTELEITKVEDNRVYEINDRPATDVMVDYVGGEVRTDFGKASLHFCIGQKVDNELSHSYDPFIIRYIAQHHPESKSISLPIKMKNGDKIWMTRRDHNKMFKAAAKSADLLREKMGNRTPFLALHFDCAGRGKIIFSEPNKLALITSLQKEVAPDIPWVGFFTYGEFCPVGQRNIFHNYSAAIALFLWQENSNDR